MRYDRGDALSKNRISAILFINVLAATLYIATVFTPYLSRHGLFNLGIPLILMWTASAFLHVPKALKPNSVLMVTALFLVWVFTTRLLGHGSASLGNIGALMLYFFPMYMYFYYKRLSNDRVSKWITLSAMVILMGNIIDNIRLLTIHPYAAKFFTGGLHLDDILLLNVGALPFTLAVAILVPTMLSLAKVSKLRIYFYAAIVIIFAYIYMSLSVTTLIISVWSAVLLSLMLIHNGSVRLTVFFLCTIVFIVTLVYLPPILINLADLVDTPAISERFYSIAMALQGVGNEESSFVARLRNSHLSLTTFLGNPVFGVGFEASLDRYATGVGMHSQIFDDMTRFGLVGIMMNVFIYFSFIKYRLRSRTTVAKGLGISYLSFLAMSLLNSSAFPETGLVVFLLLPLIVDLSCKFGHGNKVCPDASE